jgi:probable selenate reductase FAD-binding subunit
MWSSVVDYRRPKRVGDALHLLARPDRRSVPLAGGTWLIAQRDPTVKAVVDLRALNLAFIERRGRRLRLGAMTTLQSLIASPQAQTLTDGLLAEAARRSAPRAIRNVATLGGTLIAGGNTSEIALALLVLDAQVMIRAPARRVVSLAAFLTHRAEYLPATGLILEVVTPSVPTHAAAVLAEVNHTPRDRALVNAAALIARKGNVCRAARLALGGIAPEPTRLPSIEAALIGQELDQDVLARVAHEVTAAIDPPADARTSADYRREMAGVVAARALHEAWQRAEEERDNGHRT